LCLVAEKKQFAFYRFHVPDTIWFYKDFHASIQQIGGWYAKDVKALQASGVALQPISLYQKGNFRGLKDEPDSINSADGKDWMNFYRSDDYAVTAYYYLDRP
jgi:hypothetical protein